MNMSTTKRTFLTSAAVALAAVLVGAGALGIWANQNTPSASAADKLPAELNSQELGEGGLESSSIHLLSETKNFAVWEARDRAKNLCVVTFATPEGNSSTACVSEEQFQKVGLGQSMQVGEAEQGDKGIPMLQTYLLPAGADAKSAAAQIPGSEAIDQLVVRYGPLELETTRTVSVPAKNGKLELTVFGRDSI